MIAVVGLGNLGFAIARRLVGQGHCVIGIDIDPKRRETWLAMTQLDPVESLGEIDWEQVNAVFVVVRLADQAREVLEQLSSLRSSEPLVAYVVTTLNRSVACTLGSFNTALLRVIELPVSGGEAGADAGTLTVMASGPLGVEDEQFLLDTVAETFVRFDEYGKPTLAKLLNNILAAYNAAAFSHVILMGEQHGLSPTLLHRVIMTSSGSSWILDSFLEFPADLLTKDVELLRIDLGTLPSVDLHTTGTNSLERLLEKARTALVRRAPIPG